MTTIRQSTASSGTIWAATPSQFVELKLASNPVGVRVLYFQHQIISALSGEKVELGFSGLGSLKKISMHVKRCPFSTVLSHVVVAR